MSSRRMNDIEALSEQLGFLQIMKEASEMNKQTDIEMLEIPAQVTSNENIQAIIPKGMVLNPGQFNSN